MSKKRTIRILLIIGIISIICIILCEIYFLSSRFKYSKHLDETLITVDGTEITLREFGYYIYQVEDFVQKQAILYDPEDYTHWWHTHFSAGLDSTFVSDYARKTAVNTCVCNKIYYQESQKMGLTLTPEEEAEVTNKAVEMYDGMTKEQLEVTELTKPMIYQSIKEETLARKYASALISKTSFSGYADDPQKLLNWDGAYYQEKILPEHEVEQNEELLNKITFGRITVNQE